MPLQHNSPSLASKKGCSLRELPNHCPHGLVGLYPKVSWWLLVGCFISFLAASLDQALAGASSCGCFGTLQVSPWYTAGFDAICLILLWIAQPETQSLGMGYRRFVAFVGLALVTTGSLALSAGKSSALDESGDLADGASTVVLQPDTW